MTAQIVDLFSFMDPEPAQFDPFVEPEFWPEPKEATQISLFGDLKEWWEEHWVGMPDYSREDLAPWRSVIVHFRSSGDLTAFAKLADLPLTTRTRSTWFPVEEKQCFLTKRWADES